MIKHVKSIVVLAFLALAATLVWADEYADTVNLFKNAGESGTFFAKSRGYAVFPTVGKAGVGVGGAYGKGRVYDQGKYIGDTSVTQVSFGLQLGGQAYSEIIFFEDERALPVPWRTPRDHLQEQVAARRTPRLSALTTRDWLLLQWPKVV